MLSVLYFLSIFISVPFAHIYIPSLTSHGRISSGISKNYFVLFYLYALFLTSYKGISNIFFVHFVRRTLECLFLRYKRSKMNVLQFAHGVIYYTFLVFHLHDRRLTHSLVFVVLNILQSVAHIRIFLFRHDTYTHYYLEIIIYFYVFYELRTLEMLFNLLYVISFVISSIFNRKRVIKVIKSKSL